MLVKHGLENKVCQSYSYLFLHSAQCQLDSSFHQWQCNIQQQANIWAWEAPQYLWGAQLSTVLQPHHTALGKGAPQAIFLSWIYRDFCLLTWIMMKGGNWSTTQRLSAQCWTRWICMFLLFLHLCTHVHCCYRFTNSPLPLSIPPPLSFPHGIMPVPLILFICDLYFTMSKLNGILHMICWM